MPQVANFNAVPHILVKYINRNLSDVRNHPSSYPIGTGYYFPAKQAAEVGSIPFFRIQCRICEHVETCLQFNMCVYGVLLNLDQ